MFGNKPAFGTGAGFGTATSSTFGAAKPIGTTFGSPQLFNTTQQTGSIFGSSSGTAPSTGLFGNATGTSSFGQTVPAPTTGFGFGGGQSGTGLFGAATPQPANTGMFSNVSGSAFGTPKPTFGGFGASTSGSTLFGQAAPQTQQQPGMMFNQGAATGTSMFGSSAFGTNSGVATIGAAVNGTTVKFVPVNGNDTMMKNSVSTNISTRHLCITVMKEYENKSLEELRLEDYVANRKGPQGNTLGFCTTNQPSLFSTGGVATTPGTSSLFGQGNQSKPLFGNSNAGFGSTTGGLGMFGQQPQQQQQQTVSPFGAKPLGGFGTTPTTQTPTFGGFGNTTTTFGAATQPNKPLFGQTSTPGTGTSLFGVATPAAQPTTGFGTGVNFGSGFGAQNQSGVFGKSLGFGTPATNTTPAFSFGGNTVANPGAFSFNQPKPAATGFGTGFGSGATTGFTGFGSTTNNQMIAGGGGGLFGQAKPQLSFDTGFGSNLNTTSGSFFGNTANKPAGIGLTSGFGTGLLTGTTFGTGTGLGINTSNFNFGPSASLPGFGSDPNASQLSAQQTQQQLLALATSPYGDSPLFRNVLRDPSRNEDVLKPTNPQAQKLYTGSSLYKVTPRLTPKVKLKPISSLSNRKSFFDDLHEDSQDSSTETLFNSRRNIKKLVMKSRPKANTRISLDNSEIDHENDDGSSQSQPCGLLLGRSVTSQAPFASTPLFSTSSGRSSTTPNTPATSPVVDMLSKSKTNRDREPEKPSINKENMGNSDSLSNDNAMAILNFNRARRDILSPDPVDVSDDDDDVNGPGHIAIGLRANESSEQQLHPAGIILERPGYYTIPPLDEIGSPNMVDEDGNCFVENFVIGREGYGNVYFPGITNLSKLNLDEIVHFRRKEVTIYPSDDLKPPVGHGLNKKAQITLDCVWPNDKTTHMPIKSLERLTCMNYQEKLEKVTSRLGARFVEYRPETGSWVFQVNHFSKYGLKDSDEEDGPVAAPPPQDLLAQQQHLNESGNAQISPPKVSLSNIRAHGRADYNDKNSPPSPMRLRDGGEDYEMRGILHHTLTSFPKVSTSKTTTSTTQPVERFLPSSQRLSQAIGVNSSMVESMKASFFGNGTNMDFGDDDQDEDDDMFADRIDKHVAAESFTSGRPVAVDGASNKGKEKTNKFCFQPLSNGDVISRKQKIPRLAGSMSQLSIHANVQPPATPIDNLSKFALLVGCGMSPERLPIFGGLPPLEDEANKMVAFERSSLRGRHNLIADFACFVGRSFRVGWGPNLTLVHCGTPLGQISKSIKPKMTAFQPFIVSSISGDDVTDRSSSSSFNVTVEAVNAQYMDDTIATELLLDCLEAQLSLTRVEMNGGCPLAIPVTGVNLIHNQADIASRQVADLSSKHRDADFFRQCKAVWDLTVALWGKLNPLSSSDEDDDYDMKGYKGTYARHMARREKFTEWLSSVNARTITTEIKNYQQNVSSDSRLLSVFSHMTGLQVDEAVQTAQANEDFWLSVLLSQAGGNCQVRDMLRRQLDHWEETKADRHITHDRLKIYALLAGSLVWPSSLSLINTCERLDWKRALALHLWYHCPPTATIEDAVSEYDKAHNGDSQFGVYARAPLPPYMEKKISTNDSNLTTRDNESPVLDTCYLLLKLYGDRLHRLDHMLTPNTSTPDPLDLRLSWLLSQALRALGFENLSQLQKCKLHCSFASQLITMGLWHWAIFVLLHIENALQRKAAVLDVLRRHVSVKSCDDELEKFLTEKLLVPEDWINEAKAIESRRNGDVHAEAYYLLKSRHWNEGHKLIVQYIAPDAIINENYDYLKGFLERLVPPDRSSTVSEWSSGGQVFLDYIHLSQTVDRIIKGEVSAYELEGLQPEVTNLCSRVGNLKCQSAKDRLCVSEMAKKTANLLRVVLSMGSDMMTNVPTRFMSAHIGKLPLPEDYGMQEMKTVMQSYCLELT